MTPKGFESALYYKRRLNTFNFSMYDLGTKQVQCFIWNESNSGRGACEISTCVYRYIEEMSKAGKQNFVFYSDNCWAQNKNKHYVSMLWYAMQKFELTSIEHKYLEKGHTQNENDSVHAAIETACRHVSVYTTPQWAAIISTARAKQPYKVNELNYTDFIDFKQVSKVLKNFDLDDNREKVYWSDVRTFKVTCENPNVVMLKYDYDGPVHKLNLVQRLRKVHAISHVDDITLQRLNNDQLPISSEKYNDLLGLCKAGIIPKVHHMFYLSLPHQ